MTRRLRLFSAFLLATTALSTGCHHCAKMYRCDSCRPVLPLFPRLHGVPVAPPPVIGGPIVGGPVIGGPGCSTCSASPFQPGPGIPGFTGPVGVPVASGTPVGTLPGAPGPIFLPSGGVPMPPNQGQVFSTPPTQMVPPPQVFQDPQNPMNNGKQ